MKYVTIQDCHARLFQIALDADPSEQTPSYASNEKGMRELEGILQRVRQSWYRGFLGKAAYLFVAINKGHLFLNGNKRLSLVVTMEFFYRNGFSVRKTVRHRTYLEWFSASFPSYSLADGNFGSVYEWAFYNLNKAVASSTAAHFDSLKETIEDFFRISMQLATVKRTRRR